MLYGWCCLVGLGLGVRGSVGGRLLWRAGIAAGFLIFHTGCVPDSGDTDLDVELLRRIAGGDQAALGALYDRHSGIMLGLAVRILGVPRDAEDLLHDVFLEAWRHAGDYDAARGSVKSWLLLRMRSRCLDRKRSHAVSKLDDTPVEQVALIGRGESADTLQQQIDGSRALAMLDMLPDGQRQVLVLGYLHGLSFSEIADELGIPIGTVKSRVSAAMHTLREGFARTAARRTAARRGPKEVS